MLTGHYQWNAVFGNLVLDGHVNWKFRNDLFSNNLHIRGGELNFCTCFPSTNVVFAVGRINFGKVFNSILPYNLNINFDDIKQKWSLYFGLLELNIQRAYMFG